MRATAILVLSYRIDCGTPPKNANARTWPSPEGFRCLCRIAGHEAGVRMRQVKSEEVDLALDATDDADGFTKVCLSMPRRIHQRHEDLLRPLPPAGDIVLHDRDTAREPILIAQPLEYPLRRVLLLLRL